MSLEDVISAAIAPASAAAAAADSPEPIAEPVADSPEPIESAEPVAEVPDPVGEPTADPVGEPVVPPVEPAVVPPIEPIDEFAVEHGIKAKDKSGRENRIPYSDVKRINKNAVAKATAALTATHAVALTESTAKNTEYEARLEKVGEVERMMFEDQAQFLSKLRTIPGYEELLGPQAPAAQPLSEKPPPPDTETGYSPEGLQKLLAWTTDQARASAVKEATEAITKRYGPIEDRYKREEAEAKFEADTAPKIQALLKDARDNWQGYKENEAEIQRTYLADNKLTLEAAWRKVVLPKLTTDRAKMRTELLAEIAAAPRGTGITPGAAQAPAARTADPNKPMDLEETIRHSIAALKK